MSLSMDVEVSSLRTAELFQSVASDLRQIALSEFDEAAMTEIALARHDNLIDAAEQEQYLEMLARAIMLSVTAALGSQPK
jgi:hypothetical protein